VSDMASMRDEDWDAYHQTIVAPSENPERDFGSYAIAARKRRHGACPHRGAGARVA